MSTTSASMQILPVDALSAAHWDEIWQLTCRFYEADRAYVEDKLRGNDRLALYRSRADGSLIGMAAINVEPLEFQGERLLMIFTSHAIMDERYRGHNLIQRAGFRTWAGSFLRYPLHRKFWVFDTFSYRSYLLLPRNLRAFWPRRDRPTPERETALMEYYGRQKYGDAWRGGLVERSPLKRLRPQTATLLPHMLDNPDVAFFARSNPHHAEGDMMLCLCPLTVSNAWGILSRAFSRAWRKRRGTPEAAVR